MLSDFEKKYLKFRRDDAAQGKVLAALTNLTGNRNLAIDFLDEVIYDHLFIKNAKKNIVIHSSFVGFVLRSATNKWIDLDRREKTQKKYEADFFFLFEEELLELHPEKSEGLIQKEIIRANQYYIQNNIEQLISDEFKRYILLAYYDEGKSYKEIARELQITDVKKTDGTNYTSRHLSVINYRTIGTLRKLIEHKYPDFTTKLISKDDEE